MSWQAGDIRLAAGNRELVFRLTLGALAEICDRLGTRSVRTMTQRLARATPEDWRGVAVACLRPVHGEGAGALSRTLSAGRIAQTTIQLFEEAFGAS